METKAEQARQSSIAGKLKRKGKVNAFKTSLITWINQYIDEESSKGADDIIIEVTNDAKFRVQRKTQFQYAEADLPIKFEELLEIEAHIVEWGNRPENNFKILGDRTATSFALHISWA